MSEELELCTRCEERERDVGLLQFNIPLCRPCFEEENPAAPTPNRETRDE